MTLARSFVIFSVFGVCSLLLYHILPFGPIVNILQHPTTPKMTSEPPQEVNQWSSRLNGFLKRAELQPADAFNPKRPLIELVVLRNSQVEHSGITLVLFNDHTVMDATGKYYKLIPDDYTVLHELAQAVTLLPVSQGFRNQWRVKHDRTGRPIDRFLVVRKQLEELPKEDYTNEFHEIGIYGWDKHKIALEEPVHTYTDLAPPLFEIGGVAAEAREGSNGPRDDAALAKARAILGNVF